MRVQKNQSLEKLSTMRLGGNASFYTELESYEDVASACAWAKANDTELRVIGGGSNIFFDDSGFSGLIAVCKLKGIKVVDETDTAVTVQAAAGEIWDDLVQFTVERGLSGIETLSLIPGSVGAAPVQNIGAYGQQLADTFIELEAYDTTNEKLVTLAKEACRFGYRSSQFKGVDYQRYVITSITLKLSKSPTLKPPFYKDIEQFFAEHDSPVDTSPKRIREAVLHIRRNKLPDPTVVANNGSFFKLPIVTAEHLAEIRKKWPDLPADTVDDGKLKVRTGWILEKLGYKGYRHPNGMGTFDTQAMVVVNYSAKSSKDLMDFVDQIKQDVYNQTGITLENEPELIKSR